MTNELPEMMGRLGSQLDCYSAMLDSAGKDDVAFERARAAFERARQAFWANAVPAPRWSAKPEPCSTVSALTGDHRLSQGGNNGRG
jgi:hypothetical protein